MRVMRMFQNKSSIRLPLEVCAMNNTDFDGDENWIFKLVTADAINEQEEAWDRVWITGGRESVKLKLSV
jgi:hypothetical protein